MLENVKWIFFDIGSTLIDEQVVYQHIFQNISEATGFDYTFIYQSALEYFKNNQMGDIALCKKYGLPKRKWDPAYEKLYPDTIGCLENLQSKYHLGILANQLPGLENRLQAWGIKKYFDCIISSAEIGIAKPDPLIFQTALMQAKCKPCEAIMVGDRIDNDILPAKQIGMKTIWIKQGFGAYWNIQTKAETPDIIVSNLTELYKQALSFP